MRKVIFATPCYDGKVHVEFLQSLIHTIPLALKHDIALHPVQICHDALIQRARNDCVKMALDTGCDDLIFMDSDQEWEPEWVIRLLEKNVDVVGCPVPKKSDTNIDFNVKRLPECLQASDNGLIRVASVGTGFIRISRFAMEKVWEISPEYEGGNRMVFDVQLIDGQIISEDTVFCEKWRSLGGNVWIDPTMTCNHIGIKKYTNNFESFIKGMA